MKRGRQIIVSTKNSMSLSMSAIAANPRDYTLGDIQTACSNVKIESPGKGLPSDVLSVIEFLLCDFFSQAYRTGLNNRQKDLWAALGRIVGGRVEVQVEGLFFRPSKAPVYDILLWGEDGLLSIICRLVKSSPGAGPGPVSVQDSGERNLRFLSSLVKKVNKIQGSTRTLKGAFICFSEPVPEKLIGYISELVKIDDPVYRYEARLPEPAAISLNVLGISRDDEFRVKLLLPDLASARKKNAKNEKKQE